MSPSVISREVLGVAVSVSVTTSASAGSLLLRVNARDRQIGPRGICVCEARPEHRLSTPVPRSRPARFETSVGET